VGAVVLKRLDRALADGDRVYAVIRDTASGFRPGRPTPAGSRRRDDDALAAADVGLNQSRDTIVRHVGDAGAALGIVGITAAVLQVGQGVIAPVRDGEEAVPWQRERDEQGGELPRSATVAVDGDGGLVAHAIVEEFVPAAGVRRADGAGRPELVLLSAPTPAHLAATAVRLADWLETDAKASGPVLADVARVLRAGRAAMSCRIALLVGDVPQLVAGLRRFAETGAGGGDVRHADLRDSGGDPLELGEAPETRDYVAALWRSGRLEQLTRLWLSGVEIDWAGLENRPATAEAVPPPSALLRRTLWLDPVGERAG
jgi:acyl transferase domain-containing protein